MAFPPCDVFSPKRALPLFHGVAQPLLRMLDTIDAACMLCASLCATPVCAPLYYKTWVTVRLHCTMGCWDTFFEWWYDHKELRKQAEDANKSALTTPPPVPGALRT